MGTIRALILLSSLLVVGHGFGQSRISGTVHDELSGDPVARVALLSRSGDTLARTDSMGMFRVVIPADSLMRFWKPDYFELLLKWVGEPSLSITMQPFILSMDVVEVEAYLPRQSATLQPQLIRQRTIEALDPLSVERSLNALPGVYMQTGQNNTNRITIRGAGSRTLFGTDKVRAYWNHIPLTDGAGESTLEDMDLQLADEIRVYRGPTSALFNAGLGGAIHLISRLQTDRAIAYQGQLLTGSYGLWSLRNRIQLRPSEQLQVSISQARQVSNGFRENQFYRRDNLATLGQWLHGRHVLQWMIQWIETKGYLASSINEATFRSNPGAAAANWAGVQGYEYYTRLVGGLHYAFAINDRQSWHAAIYQNRHDGFERRPFDSLDDLHDLIGWRTFWQYEDGRMQAVLGAEGQREGVTDDYYETGESGPGAYLNTDNQTRRHLDVFGQWSWTVDAWTFAVNAQWQRVGYTFVEDYEFPWILSPGLRISHQSSSGHQVHLLLNKGVSHPGPDVVRNEDRTLIPGLLPEKGWNLEGQYVFSPGQSRLQFQANVYYMWIRDQLVLRRLTETISKVINAGSSGMFGAEILASYPWELGNHTVTQTLAYTFADYHFLDFKDGDNDYSGLRLPGTPRHRVNYRVAWDWKHRWHALVQLIGQDRLTLRDDESAWGDGYFLMHLNAGRTFRFGSKQLELFGQVDNLTNTLYASMFLINAGSFGGAAPRYYYPGMPRSFRVGARVEL
ncbi:MAG: TonB-dependent receptor [Saprospiraceae bacterium]